MLKQIIVLLTTLVTTTQAKYRVFRAVVEKAFFNVLLYRGEINSDVKGSGCFVLEFLFSPPSSVVQLSKHNRH